MFQRVQSMEGQCLWILDLVASSHIFGNISSFLFIASPKVSHLVNVASGSKVTYEGIGQIYLLP